MRAEPGGRVIARRRLPEAGALVREDERYRPWIVLDRLDARATQARRQEG